MKKLDLYFEKARSEKSSVLLSEVEKILHERKSISGNNTARRAIEDILRLTRFQQLAVASVTVLLVLTFTFIIWHKKHNLFHEENFYSYSISPGQQRWINLVNNIKKDRVNSPIRLVTYDALAKRSILPLHMRSMLELDEATLNAIGIRLENDKIIYEGNIGQNGYVRISVKFFEQGGNAQSLHVGPVRKDIKTYDFCPLFMTTENGGPCVRYQLRHEPESKFTPEYFYQIVDELIPIQVKGPIGKEKFIFWYTSNPAFLDILEKKAKMSSERMIAPPETKIARSATADIRLYPTITKNNVTLSMDASETQYMSVDIMDLSGVLQQQSLPETRLEKGTQQFVFDLSDLKAGIYFLRLRLSSGEISTHRIFKE